MNRGCSQVVVAVVVALVTGNTGTTGVRVGSQMSAGASALQVRSGTLAAACASSGHDR